MKLIIILTFFLSMHAFASVKAQKIDLTANNESLRSVLSRLEEQSNYSFIIKEQDLKLAKTVTVNVKSKDALDVLAMIFKDQPLQYRVTGKIVSIFPKEEQPTIQKKTETDQDAIRGRVTDQDGKPLAGATIKVKGTNTVSMTDQTGQFTMPAPDLNSKIEVTFLGYGTTELLYTGNHTINITLSNATATIQEIEVNAGYWKVNDKLRTGNISKVDGDVIRQQPVTDPMLALAGRVPGLQVTQISGLPGTSSQFRIRGINSIANGREPLFLIDGIPFTSNSFSSPTFALAARLSPFAMLNAEEIESVEVLKDADATAIYGSQGANGVILITTKKGKAGRTQFNVNAYTGAGKVTNMLDLMNTQQYLEMRREAFRNDGVTTYPASARDVNGTWDTTSYTDWQKELIGNTARMSNLQLQVSGGNLQTQFTAGGGYMRENTVFPGDYKTNKASANLSVNHRSADSKFGINASIRYLVNSGDQPQSDVTSNYIYLPPNTPSIYAEDGELNWANGFQNPFSEFLKRSKSVAKNLITNAVLDYQILSGLQAKLNFGYTTQDMKQDLTVPIKAFQPSLRTNPANRSHNQGINNLVTWILEPQLNYSKAISSGLLNITVGSTFREDNQEIRSITANNFTDDALIDNIAAATTVLISLNQQKQYKYAALFGRVNYNWNDKYLVNIVARRDGSSRFAPGRKYGNFASVGGAWIFTKESFFKNSVLNFGKLRASYGITGNDQLDDYQYFNTYTPYMNSYLGVVGLSPTRLSSLDYSWEAVKKTEVALDLGFLQDRIRLSNSFYRNRTDNQLVGYTLPTMTGFPSIQANLPAVVENKGWELELNTINLKNAKFEWLSSFNLTISRNKLVSFPNFETSTYRNTYTLGKSLSTQKKWHYIGVDPATGIVQYEDVNSDGKISSPEDLQSLVNLEPKYMGGFSNTFQYSNFRLDIFFQFINKIGRGGIFISPPGQMGNQRLEILERWRQTGDVTDIPKYSNSGAAITAINTGNSSSDRLFTNASFIRLKNLSLSYQLPKSVLQNIKVSNCSIYLQGQNLMTFTDYKGFDPETESTSLPPVRMITAGFNITF